MIFTKDSKGTALKILFSIENTIVPIQRNILLYTWVKSKFEIKYIIIDPNKKDTDSNDTTSFLLPNKIIPKISKQHITIQ